MWIYIHWTRLRRNPSNASRCFIVCVILCIFPIFILKMFYLKAHASNRWEGEPQAREERPPQDRNMRTLHLSTRFKLTKGLPGIYLVNSGCSAAFFTRWFPFYFSSFTQFYLLLHVELTLAGHQLLYQDFLAVTTEVCDNYTAKNLLQYFYCVFPVKYLSILTARFLWSKINKPHDNIWKQKIQDTKTFVLHWHVFNLKSETEVSGCTVSKYIYSFKDV